MHKKSQHRNRRGSRRINILKTLLLFSLWISNTILGCQALPRLETPKDESFRSNFATMYGAPLITPLMEDVTLEVDSNYTLRCEADEQIVWKIPSSFAIRHEAKTFNTQDPERPFGSVLYLSGVQKENVGSYYCIKESSMDKHIDEMEEQEFDELVNNNQASSIYIYVNDMDNLLVPFEFPVGYAYQYQDFTIPCKPTMPTVEVLLTTPNGDTYSSESTGRYDPRRGFVIQMRGVTDGGMYFCRPKVPSRSNEEEETSIDIEFRGNKHIDLTTKLTNDQLETTSTLTTTAMEMVEVTTTAITTKIKTASKPTKTKKSTVTNTKNVTNRIVQVVDVLVGGGNNRSNNNKNNNSSDNNSINNIYNNSIDYTEVANKIIPDRNFDQQLYRNVGVNDGFSTTTTAPFVRFYASTVGDHGDVVGVDGADRYVDGVDDDGDLGGGDDGDGDDDVGGGDEFGGDVRSLGKRDVRTTASHRSSYYNLRSTPRSHTTHVNKPQITSVSRGHSYEGDTFQLVCEVKIAHDVSYTTEWITPPGVSESRVEKKEAEFHNKTETHTFGRAVLTVRDAHKSDSGNYKCIVTDHSKNRAHNNYLMTILKKNESYINISEPNDYYIIKEKAGKTIQINVKYRGFPWPTLTWYNPNGVEILPTSKYLINITDTSIMLKIISPQMTDSGEYILRAENGFVQKELQFNVSISGVPIVTVSDVYVQAGQEAHVTCSVLSYPTALVSWVFRACSIQPRWPSCDKRLEQSFNSTRSAKPGEVSIEYIHELYFTPTSPGILQCVAINKIDKAFGKGHVLIGDIADNMTVAGIDERQKIARGDEVVITCSALAYYYAEDLEWYRDGEIIAEGNGVEIVKAQTEYSYKKSLKFRSIQDGDRGSYECRARDANYPEQSDSKYINIFVHEPVAPHMVSTNLEPSSKMNRKLGDVLELECKSEAIPQATVAWYKDDVEIVANENIGIDEDGAKLVIPFIKPEDEGVYKCVVANRLGVIESSGTVKITNMPGLKLGWILGILFFFIVLIFLVIYLCVRVNRERKLLRELKAAGLANFEEGAVEHINPALTLDEQADLLPYDRRFEFPRHKLKLGKQLGAGAFGVVLKAHAEGIKVDEKETVVAVKMVKRTADNEVMKALVSELKIMVHLGQHLNVVNLLGAVTENIAKREVMVIVEYCRYGNVQNFLLRNRKRFIDQIHPETDKIDPTIVTQRFSDNFEINRNSDNDPRSGTRAGRPNSSGYLRQSDLYEGQVDSCATEQTVMTTIPEGEDNILSNNSVQPAWRSNYKPDSTEAMTITTSDLISWAFQVARGMDYLASRKVLHGDLAARNILLCEDNVVKICDFGLARSMYKSENYKKQGEAPLPIKWLALESLSDHVFSTYTDVWSYGIVLWEFFSLAKVPYPGMDPNQSLYMKLKDGYRMEKPPFANDELYDIMLECWSTNPECRPLFHVLEKKFAKMLGDEVTNHYLELNDTYLKANDEYFKRTDTDYLALMSAPDEMAPAPPRYVNGHILPEIRIEPSYDDYLQMSAKSGTAIFSPTRPKDFEPTHHDNHNDSTTTSSFTFPDTAAAQHSPTLANNLDSPASQKTRREKDAIASMGVDVDSLDDLERERDRDREPEEIPMLQHKHKSDDADSSPEQCRKFGQTTAAPTPSPRHHVAETPLTGEDNYVNVKSPKKLLNNNINGSNGGARASPDAFSNPSYQMLKTVNEGAK